MIKSTKNYDLFKKHEHNRPLVEGNVLKIMRSIQFKNLLEFRPILVDSRMQIVDGQHRLEACRRLEIPVFYDVQPELQKSDIILLNDNSKQWSREDYLNYFCQEGNVEYLKLRSFMQKNKIHLSTALVVLGVRSSPKKRTNGIDPFKRGVFSFPKEHEEIEAVNILTASQKIIDYLDPKMEGNHTFIHGASFRRALYLFLSLKAVELDVFMDKLAYRMDLVRPCARLPEFLNILKLIYNWKNRNPVTLEEFS